jgi:hypothetical protein
MSSLLRLQALRRDPDLHNLTQHSKNTEAPPADPALLRSAGSSGLAADGGSPKAAAAAAKPAAEAGQHTDSTQSIMSSWGRGTNIVGSANWRDIFMLRGSSETIRKYNSAQPLPVIAGLSLDELANLGCSRHFYSSEWEEMSPQQQQKQQSLPRARSLSNLFAAGGSSSDNDRDRNHGNPPNPGNIFSNSWIHRSNSTLTDTGEDDTPQVPDTRTAAAAAATTSAAHSATNSSSGVRYTGCWPRSKQQQQVLPQHQQPGCHPSDQQQQQASVDNSSSRSYRRFFSADGSLQQQQQQQQQQQRSGLSGSVSFSFPHSRGSVVDSSGGGWVGSNGKAAAALKRVPSTRFVLISRNCSCCKVCASALGFVPQETVSSPFSSQIIQSSPCSDCHV